MLDPLHWAPGSLGTEQHMVGWIVSPLKDRSQHSVGLESQRTGVYFLFLVVAIVVIKSTYRLCLRSISETNAPAEEI